MTSLLGRRKRNPPKFGEPSTEPSALKTNICGKSCSQNYRCPNSDRSPASRSGRAAWTAGKAGGDPVALLANAHPRPVVPKFATAIEAGYMRHFLAARRTGILASDDGKAQTPMRTPPVPRPAHGSVSRAPQRRATWSKAENGAGARAFARGRRNETKKPSLQRAMSRRIRNTAFMSRSWTAAGSSGGSWCS